MRFYQLIKAFLLTLFFLTSHAVTAQEVKLIKGEIYAGTSDLDKIHVINITQEKGAVTDAEGKFVLTVKENDSLYISSVQYENRYITVSKEIMKNEIILITLSPKVNELAEVVIDDIILSGYLANDLSKISVKDVETKFRLQNNLNDYIRKDREQNPYIEPGHLTGGIKLDKIAGAIAKKLVKTKEAGRTYNSRELANLSIKTVGYEFFREDLNLESNEVCNFLFFCEKDASYKHLVINENAFALIEYFERKIDDFKKLRGSLLNTSSLNIPG